MNNRHTAQHKSDAMSAFISGGLIDPHLPDPPTPEQARKVLPWLERETDHPITWKVVEYRPGRVKFAGHIRASDPAERRSAIESWASVIGSWSISEADGRHEAIGRYQGFDVELTATV